VITAEGLVKVYIQVPSGANAIRFMSQFSAQAAAERSVILEYVNRVNRNLRLPRAYFMEMEDRKSVIFDHYLYVDSGIAEASFVASLRRFHRVLRSAVDQDTENALA
jgi:hypothetical protein